MTNHCLLSTILHITFTETKALTESLCCVPFRGSMSFSIGITTWVLCFIYSKIKGILANICHNTPWNPTTESFGFSYNQNNPPLDAVSTRVSLLTAKTGIVHSCWSIWNSRAEAACIPSRDNRLKWPTTSQELQREAQLPVDAKL